MTATNFPETWRLPLGGLVDQALAWLVDNGGAVFAFVADVLRWILLGFERTLLATPWWTIVVVVGLIAWRLASAGLGLGCAAGLVFLGTLGMWDLTMATLALVLTATVLSVLIGLPVGVWCARSDRALFVVRPLLDLMQTMPSFVYLIPALMLFGLGRVPALIATIAYATPPTIRLTNLGIRHVSSETIEAARAFGATPRQLLRKVQLPLAFPTIMAGINQTIMMALAMVVIASMIGAGGLGREVLEGLARLEVGRAFVGGTGIVVLAVIIDRISAQTGRSRRDRALAARSRLRSRWPHRRTSQRRPERTGRAGEPT